MKFIYYCFYFILLINSQQIFSAEDNLNQEKASKPKELISWTVQSENNQFSVTISPYKKRYVFGQFHQWLIQVTNKDGQPVKNAQMRISGGMFGHGHGLPSQPQVSSELSDGKYLVDGMLFNMSGDWTLFIAIKDKEVIDRAKFDITLEY